MITCDSTVFNPALRSPRRTATECSGPKRQSELKAITCARVDALASAGLAASDVDYINLHGTATLKNDEVEAALVADGFRAATRASSTKGWTGHALGAAGILEAVLTLLAIRDGLVPGTLNTTTPDARCGPQLALDNESRTIRVALSNSFGFGGNNCTLAFGAARTH